MQIRFCTVERLLSDTDLITGELAQLTAYSSPTFFMSNPLLSKVFPQSKYCSGSAADLGSNWIA